MFKTLFKTLSAQQSIITFTDIAITNDSIFEVYPDNTDIIPTSVTVNGNTATIVFDKSIAYNCSIALFINNLVGEFNYIDKVGDLSALETSIKNNAVNAINEIFNDINTLASSVSDDIGDVSELLTGTNLVEGINNNYQNRGDTVLVDQIQSEGTHIADIEINGITTELYAPTGGGGDTYPLDSTPIKIGKVGNYDLYRQYFSGNTGNTERTTIGQLPANSKAIKVCGYAEASENDRWFVGTFYDATYWKILILFDNLNVQTVTGNNLRNKPVKVWIDYYIEEV